MAVLVRYFAEGLTRDDGGPAFIDGSTGERNGKEAERCYVT